MYKGAAYRKVEYFEKEVREVEIVWTIVFLLVLAGSYLWAYQG